MFDVRFSFIVHIVALSYTRTQRIFQLSHDRPILFVHAVQSPKCIKKDKCAHDVRKLPTVENPTNSLVNNFTLDYPLM